MQAAQKVYRSILLPHCALQPLPFGCSHDDTLFFQSKYIFCSSFYLVNVRVLRIARTFTLSTSCRVLELKNHYSALRCFRAQNLLGKYVDLERGNDSDALHRVSLQRSIAFHVVLCTVLDGFKNCEILLVHNYDDWKQIGNSDHPTVLTWSTIELESI